MKMKKTFILACAVSAVSTGLAAQESSDAEVYLGATHHAWDNDRNLDDATGLDLGAEVPVTDKLSFDAWVSKVDADAKNTSVEYEGMRYSLGGLYHLDSEDAQKNQVRPFATFGLSHQEFDIGNNAHDEGIAYIGVGLKKYFDNNFIVRGDVFGMRSLDYEVTDLGLRLAIGYAFGRDTSKGLLSNKALNEATETGKKEVEAAKQGLEEKPEEAKEAVKATAPENVENKVIAVTEVKEVVKDAPALDTDKDGVIDSLDKCGGTDKAFKVDESGCPVMLLETVSINMNVSFASNSAVVEPENFSEIEKVARFMKQFDQTKVTVEGHSDDRGRDAYNKKLSQKRADAVRMTLINEFGLDGGRIDAIGYGEEQPIADNATAEGRAKNRRVVGVIESTIEKPAVK